MELAVGEIYEGKVTGITAFGAFVQLPVGRTGMVHISEVADTYVDDIKKHLSAGQIVSVKVIGIDAAGRVNLSVKKAIPPPPREEPKPAEVTASGSTLGKSEDDAFENRLKMFMQNSKSRMSDLKSQSDKKSGRRRK